MTKMKCVRPWLTLFNNDKCRVCCTQKTNIGTVDENSTLESIWNSEKAQELRRDMIESSKNDTLPHKHCPENCTELTTLDEHKNGKILIHDELRNEILDGKTILSQSPIEVGMVIDSICNLKCKMCWIFDEKTKLHEIDEQGTVRILSDIKDKSPDLTHYVQLIGGEVFYSKYSRYIFKRCVEKNFKIRLITNMSIFDEKLLNTIPINNITNVIISADAGTKDTYTKIKRGNWDIFQNNINKLCEWKNNRSLLGERFWNINISHIIMRSNYTELLSSIDQYLKYPAHLEFICILPSYRPNSYEQIFHTIPLQEDLLFRLNEAIDYVQYKKDNSEFGELITPLSDTNITTVYKMSQYNVILRSLNKSKNYLLNIMENEQHNCFEKPQFDYNIDNKKNIIVTKI